MYTYKELIEIVQQYFAAEHFTGTPAHLYEPIDYTLSQGGKRIRPVLLLAAADMLGADLEEARYAAIGLETFHNFTLLHDDLMDQSPMRRGKPTVYRKWDENTAVLSGDAMNILAWRYFLRKPHPQLLAILRTFEQTSMEICEGQQYDMDFEQRTDVRLDEYMEMIRLKTAVLLGCALKIGALYANAGPDDTQHLYQFGINLGLAFQLRDDLLDTYGDPATFGKETGTDIRDNKKTFLLLSALEKADPSRCQRLLALCSTRPEAAEAKVKEVTEIYNSLGIKEITEQKITCLHQEALQHLQACSVPDERKKTLQNIAQTLLNRNA